MNWPFRKKSTTPGTKKPQELWVSKGSLRMFDFNNVEDIFIALQTNPELVSIVGYLSKSFSLGNWQHTNLDKLIENSWLVDLLNNPHPLYDGTELKTLIAANLIAYGRVHLYVNQPGVITSSEGVFLLPTPLVKVLTDKKNSEVLDITDISDIITKYKVSWPDGTQLIDPSKIITISTASVSDIQNGEIIYQSPLKSLDTVLKISPTIYTTMYELNFNRGAIGIIYNDTSDTSGGIPFQEGEKEDLQKAYKKYGTLTEKFHMIFSDKKLGYKPISAKIKEMMLPEQLLEVKRIISDVLMFDILLLNSTEGKKYDNYSEARESLFTETLMPLAENVSLAITKFFLFARPKEKITLDYKYLELFADDQTQKAEGTAKEIQYIIELNTAVKNGLMSWGSAVALLVKNGYPEQEAATLITLPVVESVSSDINNEVSQEQLEAQANLRGSVGGVQGILAIQSSVQSGTTDRSAAIATLIEIYGFEESTANTILGTP